MNPVERMSLLSSVLEHVGQYRGPAAPGEPQDFTITIAREAGTPGSSVAHEVGRRLAWQVYDNELLQMIADQLDLQPSVLESVDERCQSVMRQQFERFMALPTISDARYAHQLVKVILALGTHGRAVIVGRGAAHILPPSHTLRVRLIAPLEDRIRSVSERMELSLADARRHVEDTDRERTRFVREHFQVDPTDPTHYDLVLNTSRLSVPACAEVIVSAALRLRDEYVCAKMPEPAAAV